MFTQEKEIRVLLFEENDSIRRSLAALINGSDGYHFMGEFSDFSNLIKAIAVASPDVLLMGTSKLSTNTGIDLIKKLKILFPDVRVLIHAASQEDKNIFVSICNGANGYILKGSSPVFLLQSIKDVHEGGSPMSPMIGAKVLEMVRYGFVLIKNDFSELTAREREILLCIVEGMSFKSIALNFSVCLETVKTHTKNIYKKLQVHSKSEALLKVLKSEFAN